MHMWMNLCTRVCIYYVHLLSLGSHYETDASEALGKLSLIGLTETHQQVSTLPHKHTHTCCRFASHFTVIFHCFYILCKIWHQDKNMSQKKRKLPMNEMQRAQQCSYVFAYIPYFYFQQNYECSSYNFHYNFSFSIIL